MQTLGSGAASHHELVNFDSEEWRHWTPKPGCIGHCDTVLLVAGKGVNLTSWIGAAGRQKWGENDEGERCSWLLKGG